MDDVLLQPATEAAAMLRRKQISSRGLTELLLARIDRLNPALNAVVDISHEVALRAAKTADDMISSGDRLGQQHGVPMTVKDCLQVAGLHNTRGNHAFAEHVADWDATVVRRLRAAGGLIVGKSNLAFMLGDFAQTSNQLYGRTNNPWDVARSPGGSSGGAAAAVAAGLSVLEHGSDLVGSMRIPAAFCGVYCLRPHRGRCRSPVCNLPVRRRCPARWRTCRLSGRSPDRPSTCALRCGSPRAWRTRPRRRSGGALRTLGTRA